MTLILLLIGKGNIHIIMTLEHTANITGSYTTHLISLQYTKILYNYPRSSQEASFF